MKTVIRIMFSLFIALGIAAGAYLFAKGDGKNSCKDIIIGTLKAANCYQGLALR